MPNSPVFGTVQSGLELLKVIITAQNTLGLFRKATQNGTKKAFANLIFLSDLWINRYSFIFDKQSFF